ncbi:Com family DNA-binding transcriptional regulator [Roseospirillum parvum]|uniref:Com family DNA-binding transcriptional regulator n=1 Tax=Roseospirillum parvum TaxID=83401 RepID=UPI001C409C90|nr:Com family DNA-binding transcriptional regulator [Roseospirillum parvum]
MGIRAVESIRCANCNKLLARAEFARLEIKCPRCGTVNHLRAQSPSPERHRASSSPRNDAHGLAPASSPAPSRADPTPDR